MNESHNFIEGGFMKNTTHFLLMMIFLCFINNFSNAQWKQQSSGTSIALNSVAFSDINNGTVAGGSGALGGPSLGIILRTSDGGSTWVTQLTGTIYYSGVSFTDINHGTVVGENGTILRTVDGGINWTPQSSGTTKWLYAVCFTDVNNGTVVGENGTILRTTNGGTTWITQSSGTSVFLCGVYFIDENIGFVGGQNGVILRTTNGGTNWSQQSSGTWLVLVGILFTDANNGIAVGGNYDFEGNGSWWSIILRTTNGGDTWTTQATGTEYMLTGVSFTELNNGTAVGWGYNSGIILRTTDSGTSWIEQSSGTTNALSGVHFTDTNTGTVVGAYGTILRTTNGGVTFVDEDKNDFTPNGFILSQNYPNPFNPTTTIRYTIQTSEFVTLKVYDVLGNEVATLVNEEKPAGSYEVNFDASQLSSGIYFYKLQAGNPSTGSGQGFVETKKMLLLK
jgi:photosystem II stability/assembly factor-like uncharacterized protein